MAADLSKKLREYEFLVTQMIHPLYLQRKTQHGVSKAQLEDNEQRSLALDALCAAAATAAPGPSTPYTPPIDLGDGVLVLPTGVDANQTVLVDVGEGVYLEMEPREALIFSRRVTAEARSREALCARDYRLVVEDLLSSLDSLIQLKSLVGDGGRDERPEGKR